MPGTDISIIVPTFERREPLIACLAALGAQEGGPYETIVVDDGGSTQIAEICAAAGPWVRLIRQANSGPAKARNAGARAASGRFLCFTDDDCMPEPGWAKALAAAGGGEVNRLVGGLVRNALPDNLYAETAQSITDYIYDWHRREHGGGVQFFTTNNVGCARSAFIDSGGFDEQYSLAGGEDREFGIRWAHRVGPLVYAPEAVVRHAHELDARGFWRQQANYGRGARRLHLAAPATAQPVTETKFERPSFYAGLLFHPMKRSDWSWTRKTAISALCCISQLAIARGFFEMERRPGP